MVVSIIIIILLVVVLLLFVYMKCENFSNITYKKFKAPPSFTKVNANIKVKIENVNDKADNLLEKYAKKLDSISNFVTIVDKVNFIELPTFFNCNEKWEGCLPRPLYQGTCGSCWGFASATCLSSRFYIESCGNAGCQNYPQIDAGSLDDVFANINNEYSFKREYLKTFALSIDTNKNDIITEKEWYNTVLNYQKKIYSKIDDREKHSMVQVLVYMLDFQSMGSLEIRNLPDVKRRANKTYKLWKLLTKSNNKGIKISSLIKLWRNQPLNLSAEKIIACCTDCMSMELKDNKLNNPVCSGGSLEDAWRSLRDTGTTSSLCIGYNLDNYTEGDKLSSCSVIQGPYYSFCSGYVFDKYDNTKLQNIVDVFNESDVNPPAMTQDIEEKVPWTDPQIFRFRAKNAYNITDDVLEIQREILQRGPVNSGFNVYKDFEEDFGGQGLGGQLYSGGIPIGSNKNCLIYMKDPNTTDKPSGGHAITIVGWGSFVYSYRGKEYSIPYWTCLNSWGVEWGHNGFPNYDNRSGLPENLKLGGYFWIVRGINNCGIEENVTCGQPNIENMSYPGIVDRYGWGVDPPSLNNKSISFLPIIDINNRSVNGGYSLQILPATEGGGTYTSLETDDGHKVWKVKSMDSPSPYLMFWPNQRPSFCIGKILEKISSKDNLIKLNGKSIEFLNTIIPITKNPLLILVNDNKKEQVQLLLIGDGLIKVSRAVNSNKPFDYPKGSEIRIFPYQNISTDFLINNGFLNSC